VPPLLTYSHSHSHSDTRSEEPITKKPAATKRAGRKAAEPVAPRTSGRTRKAVASYKDASPDVEDVPKKRASRSKKPKDEVDEDSEIDDLNKPNKINKASDEEEVKPKSKAKTGAKRKAEQEIKM
jgi:hypothetical protein